MNNNITLLISCNDQKGIIAALTSFVLENKGNIVYIDQYVEQADNGVFFMRLECEFISDFDVNVFKRLFKEKLAIPFAMNWDLFQDTSKIKTAVFVSKYDHCLYDILAKHASNELNINIPLIVSNHLDLEHIAKKFDIPFYYIPIVKGQKEKAEDLQLKLLAEQDIELVVLARYMQILPKKIVDKYPQKIINIHHSFLPAFPGAKPYHSAYKRGVKIIGATSHYVNEYLDEGPIIEQDVAHISHLHSIKDLVNKGKDLEKSVLSRAISLHVDRKIKVYNNKTIIFS